MHASVHTSAGFPSANILLAKAYHVAELRIMVEKDRWPFGRSSSKANMAKGIDTGKNEKLGSFLQPAVEGQMEFHGNEVAERHCCVGRKDFPIVLGKSTHGMK